jgi:hypothetical protein
MNLHHLHPLVEMGLLVNHNGFLNSIFDLGGESIRPHRSAPLDLCFAPRDAPAPT